MIFAVFDPYFRSTSSQINRVSWIVFPHDRSIPDKNWSRSDSPSLSTVSSNEPKWGKNGKFLPFRAPSSGTKLFNHFAPRPIDRKSSQDHFGGRFSSIRCTVLELSAENWRDPNREKFSFHPKRWLHHLFEMKSVLNGSLNPVEHEFVPREDCEIAGRFLESLDQIIKNSPERLNPIFGSSRDTNSCSKGFIDPFTTVSYLEWMMP